jgi:hypothetical protein
MSENLGPSMPDEEPEYLEPIAGAPAPRAVADSGGGGKRRGALIGAGLVGAGLIGAGAWAATVFFATGAQPTEALPASTLAYVSVDVEPSGEQQVEAYRFLKKFPAIRAELNLDDDTDLREELFSWAQEQGGCAEVDFAEDIEPWLGTTAAVAAVDRGTDEIAPVLVLEVTDEEAAQTGLETLRDCSGAASTEDLGGWNIADGWAVIAQDDATAQSVADAAEADPLSEDDDHAAWLDEVGDQGILTMYAGPQAPARLIDLAEQFGPDPLMGSYREFYADFTGAAGTLRFADAGLEFVAVTDVALSGGDGSGGTAGESLAALPTDTVGALGLSFGEDYVERMSDELATTLSGTAEGDAVEQLELQTGLSLPEDLQTLLGDSLVFAVGGDIDIESMANSADGSDIPIGVKITGDATGIEAVLDKLRLTLGPAGEQFLASDASGDLVAVGPSPDYRRALLSGGELGGSETFTDVIADAEGATNVAFVDFDGANNWLDRALASSGEPDAIANLEPLSGLGMLLTEDGEIARMTLRLSTD